MVFSKWRRRGIDTRRIDPCLIGTGTYGLQTLAPTAGGISWYDGASLARSQHDLCYPATPQWSTRGPRGPYVTTLEMRRKGSVPMPAGPPYAARLGGSQPMLADVWTAPCPVHGPYGPHHHVYDSPLTDDDAMMAGDGNVTSPFYHELDGPTLNVADDDGPTPPPRPPGDHGDPISAPFSRI